MSSKPLRNVLKRLNHKLNLRKMISISTRTAMIGVVMCSVVVPNTSEAALSGPGAIAFTGFNADGVDNVSWVALEPIAAGETIYFTDNEWNGLAIGSGGALIDNAESIFHWTAPGGGVTAGTIILIDNISSAGSLSTNFGTAVYDDPFNTGLNNGSDSVYAFQGTSPTTPTSFLSFVTNGVSDSLANTGLTLGTTAISLTSGTDIAAYNASRSNQLTFPAYRSQINSLSNWISQDAGGDQSIDGIGPDVPFSTTPFTLIPPNKTLVWIPANNANSINWNTLAANTNMQNGATPDFFSNGDTVQFNGNGLSSPANGAVIVDAGGVTPGAVQISNTSGTYTFSGGAIGGIGSLTKSNAGTAILAATNSYSGGTNVNGGILVVSGGDDRLGNSVGSITFGGGTLRTDSLGLASSRAIGVSTGGGTFDTNGLNSSTTGGVSVSDTLTKAGSGDLAFNGSVGFGPTGSLHINAGTVTIGSPSGSTISMSNGAVFTGDLIINSTSRLNFNTTGQTYGGTGQIKILGSALGAGSGNSIIPDDPAAPGEKMFANTNVLISNLSGQTGGTITSDIVLNPTGAGHVAFSPGNVTTSNYTTGSFLAFIAGTSGAIGDGLTVNGKISGEGDLFIGNDSKAGGGSANITFNNANTYQGNTLINTGGVIKLGVSNALAITTHVVQGSLKNAGNATIDLNGNNQQIASLSDDAQNAGILKFLTITNNSGSADSTLTVSGTVTPANSFGGVISDGASSKKVSLTKSGVNLLTLSGVNTYSGNTTINGGTLVLASTGSINNTSSINVGSGATLDVSAVSSYTLGSTVAQTLKGNGTVTGHVAVSSLGTVAPGNSAGKLTVSGNLNLSAGGTYAWQLGELSASGPGTNFDQIVVGGNTTLGGTSALSLDFSALVLASQPGKGSTFWNAGHTWKVLDTASNTGGTNFTSITGTAGPGSWTTAVGTLGDAGDILLRYVAGDISSASGVGIPDAFVGGDDLNVILGHWGQNVTLGSLTLGDLSGPSGVPDGFVGGDDLNIILANWGKGPAAVGTGLGEVGGGGVAITAVPEPSTLMLAGLGLISLTLLRRRNFKR